MLKGLLAVAPALLVLAHGLSVGPKYDRYVLPAFDGYVYDAMADTPRVFTLAPWGYRILAPSIVHLLPVSSPAAGFFWLNLALLAAAVFAGGVWLRRLGFSPIVALMGGLSLAATPPLRAMLEYQVLVDPMSLVVFVAILNAFISPRGLSLAALFAVGALTKEVCLLPLFALPFVLSPRMGWKRGLAHSIAIGAPAIGLAVLLRATWGGESARVSVALLQTILKHVLDVPWSYAALFAIATVLGLRGFFSERSTQIRAVAVLLWFGCFLAVLANPYGFASPDLLRIAPFAWTPFLPLVLTGLGLNRDAPMEIPVRRRRTRDTAAIGALLGATALALQTDSYRRALLAESPDPVTFLARSRETLKTARVLDEGQAFTFDSRSGRFAGPIVERFNLTEGRQHRWFLFEGFGPDAVFESGSPEFQGEARLLLPMMAPKAVTMSIEFEGPKDARVAVNVAGRDIASIPTGTPGATFQIPAGVLFRGDNILRLLGPSTRAIRLIRFEARVEGSGRARGERDLQG